MADVSELEEALQAIGELAQRLTAVEEVLGSTKALDHKGISMVASEGLRGGGTIDKSRGFKFDYEHLTKGKLRLGNEIFCMFSPEEGEHQQIDVIHLVETVVRLSEVFEKIDEVKGDLKTLAKKVELFSFFDRLATTERLVIELKEKVDASEESQAEAAKSGEGSEEGSS